jgi:hypothetical protein
MDGEAGVVDPDRPTAAWRHVHELLPQSRDGGDTVRQGHADDGRIERFAGLQYENRPELLGYVSLQGSEHRVGGPRPVYPTR